MLRQWLKYLLIFSLSINVGGVATFIYSKFINQQTPFVKQEAPPPALKELVTLLNLDPEQREFFQKILSAHRQNVQLRHQERTLKRKELLTLLKNGNASWPDFQRKLEELRDIQFKGEEDTLRFFLELRQDLKPEQRETCDNFMECRLLKGRGEKGEWCRAQGIRRPQGKGKWRCPAAPPLPTAELGKPQN